MYLSLLPATFCNVLCIGCQVISLFKTALIINTGIGLIAILASFLLYILLRRQEIKALTEKSKNIDVKRFEAQRKLMK